MPRKERIFPDPSLKSSKSVITNLYYSSTDKYLYLSLDLCSTLTLSASSVARRLSDSLSDRLWWQLVDEFPERCCGDTACVAPFQTVDGRSTLPDVVRLRFPVEPLPADIDDTATSSQIRRQRFISISMYNI